MKKYLFLAASALALASCSSDDIIGNNGGGQQNATGSVIQFNSNAGPITRVTSNTASSDQEKLDYQFKIYGSKEVEGTYKDVFKDYSLWYENANNTTTNTNGWEYVGDAGDHGTNVNLTSDQTIKYWDYSSENYRFVAGSPIKNFKFETATDGSGSIAKATVTGLAGHINANTEDAPITTNPVYIAEPKVVEKIDYNKVVKFDFVRQQSKVRVGFYETIPGYKIKEIHFYKNGAINPETSTNVILTSAKEKYFVGGTAATGTIKYDWTSTPNPSYTFSYNEEGLTQQQDWYGGALTGVQAVTSTETDADKFYGTDKDREGNGYFTVIPTPSATNADAILIKCNYILESEDGSKETIKVTGATAAIPAAFSKWEPNVMYTYIFKISQNTNGYTGDDPQNQGLYPITFDAAVADFKNKEQGTITTVSTPSITTYQNGSVTNDGVQYKTGEDIYVEVANNTNGTAMDLTADDIKVYKLAKERNEAELQVSKIAQDELTTQTTSTIGTTGTTVGTVTLKAKKYLSFNPTNAGYYAVQYKTTTDAGDVFTYKVIKVETAAQE